MIVRLFLTSVAPGDIDDVIKVFEDDVKPAFEAQPECLSIELFLATDVNVAGLIEGGAISRWEDREGMNAALARQDVQHSRRHLLELMRREPVIKIFEVRA